MSHPRPHCSQEALAVIRTGPAANTHVLNHGAQWKEVCLPVAQLLAWPPQPFPLDLRSPVERMMGQGKQLESEIVALEEAEAGGSQFQAKPGPLSDLGRPCVTISKQKQAGEVAQCEGHKFNLQYRGKAKRQTKARETQSSVQLGRPVSAGRSWLGLRTLPGPAGCRELRSPSVRIASSEHSYIKISYIEQQTSESSRHPDSLGVNMHEKLPRND